MIQDTETLEVLQGGDANRIIAHLHGINDLQLRTSLVHDLANLSEILTGDNDKFYDKDYYMLPYGWEQEERSDQLLFYASSEAWNEWPDEFLEIVFTKCSVNITTSIDVEVFLDLVYLLPNLEFLSLENQSLVAGKLLLPVMPRLVDLKFTSSKISTIESESWLQPNLKFVNLSNNLLGAFPEGLLRIELEKLNLSSNLISMVPDELLGSKLLKSLNLDSNELSGSLRTFVKTNPNWDLFSISKNGIGDLSFLSIIETIGILDIAHNPIGSFPDTLPAISSLTIDADQYANLTPKLKEGIKSIEILSGISSVVLSKLEDIGTIEQIELNGLSVSFGEIQKFSNLRKLSVTNCSGFIGFPTGIFELKNLEEIIFEDCNIGSLNGQWANLTKLRWVSLRGCQLTLVPAEFLRMDPDIMLWIAGNKFDSKQESLIKLSYPNAWL